MRAAVLALSIACGGVARPAEEAVCWDLCPGASAVDHEKPITPQQGWAEWCECHCAADYYRGAEIALPAVDPAGARAYFAGQCAAP